MDAVQKYAALGVDVNAAIARLKTIPVSMHCWQGDDIEGFLDGGDLTGGIQTTGNYPGKARGFEQLTADLDKAYGMIPGKKRLALHAIYAVTGGKKVERDKLEPEHFDAWLDWAGKRGIMLDFNPTVFSHPMFDGLSLSHPDEKVRRFWIDHVKACRRIAAYIGEKQGSPCLNNLWIPDGFKNAPADRLTPRLRLKDSLDEIYSVKNDKKYIVDAVESKVFGIGLESCTVGSSEFYLSYAATRGINALLDNGHFHPTESTADKISSLLAFFDKVALHVTHHVRWDSDHVVLYDDEVREIADEIVGNDACDRVLIGLDYFDASINRVAAWIIGARNMQKALLSALLKPHAAMKKLQDEGNFTELMYLTEELKTMPLDEVWDMYLKSEGVPGREWFGEIRAYEQKILKERK